VSKEDANRSLPVVVPPRKKYSRHELPFDPALAEEICQRLASGEPYSRILRDDHMPSNWRVDKWQQDVPLFNEQFLRARAAALVVRAEEIVEIADEKDIVEVREVTHSAKDGVSVKQRWEDQVAHRRLRMDARIRAIQSLVGVQAANSKNGEPGPTEPGLTILITGGPPDDDDVYDGDK
jgi:hypothetical protein